MKYYLVFFIVSITSCAGSNINSADTNKTTSAPNRQSFQDSYAEYIGLHNKALSQMSSVKNKIPKVIEYQKLLNAVVSKFESHRKNIDVNIIDALTQERAETDEIRQRRHADIPGATWIEYVAEYPFEVLVRNKAPIPLEMFDETAEESAIKRIESAIKTYSTLGEKCFDVEKKKFLPTASCERMRRESCELRGFGFKDRKLYSYSLKGDLEITENTFGDFNSLVKKALINSNHYGYDFLHLAFSFCKTIAATGLNISPKQFQIFEPNERWSTLFFNPINDYNLLSNSIKEECADNLPTEEESMRIDSIPDALKKFRQFEELDNLKQMRLNKCRPLVSSLCENVFFVKKKGIMAYETESCEIRRATTWDLTKDLETFYRAGLTEAEALEHSKLIEKLETCEKLHRAGYEWNFVNPKLSKNCQKNQRR